LAHDGRAALRMIALAKHDAVLMDCQMPRLDSYETTRQIRLMEKAGQHMPVIAMTAPASIAFRTGCKAVAATSAPR